MAFKKGKAVQGKKKQPTGATVSECDEISAVGFVSKSYCQASQFRVDLIYLVIMKKLNACVFPVL